MRVLSLSLTSDVCTRARPASRRSTSQSVRASPQATCQQAVQHTPVTLDASRAPCLPACMRALEAVNVCGCRHRTVTGCPRPADRVRRLFARGVRITNIPEECWLWRRLM
jgi:hypothetical protein